MAKNQKSNKSSSKKKITLRVAGEKVTNSVERPSQKLFAEVKRQIEKEERGLGEDTPPPTTTHHPLPPPTTKKLNTSPKRDFTKVANSITRDVLPQGLFKGTSKGTYDALYLKTRGAINPKREIKAVQSDLLIWSGVSHNTLRSHLKYLESIGLIKINYKLGDNKGASYEVFLPEEVGLTTSPHPLPPPTTTHSQEVVGGTPQDLLGGGGRVASVNTGDYDSSKTSLKTKSKNDDDTRDSIFSDFVKEVENASKRLTGKGLQLSEKNKWTEVAKLIVIELELAAARTESVSSIPAFLKEVLRRKLENKPKPTAGKSSRKQTSKGVSQSLNVGKPGSIKPEEELWEEESLSAEEKQKTLLIMRERVSEGHRDLVLSMKQAYTEADWKWLMDNLEEGS